MRPPTLPVSEPFGVKHEDQDVIEVCPNTSTTPFNPHPLSTPIPFKTRHGSSRVRISLISPHLHPPWSDPVLFSPPIPSATLDFGVGDGRKLWDWNPLS